MNLIATHLDHNPDDHARYRNTLVGLAAGDAWGYQVEFTTFARMPAHPVKPPRRTWTVSDDTQMAIALNDALADLTADTMTDLAEVDATITDRFLDWMHDPDNNRAPGSTCMGSLRNIEHKQVAWHQKNGAIASWGCGAVMRVAPAAFLPADYWAGIAALQALITHNSPSAAVSALFVADAIRHANSRKGRFIRAALATVNAIFDGTHPWLSDSYLAEAIAPALVDGQSVQDYLIDGLVYSRHPERGGSLLETLHAADDQQAQYREMSTASVLSVDPCRSVGEGWNSPSATALALLVADMGTSGVLTPYKALAWASTSNGDSDSIAAIGGAILGATSETSTFWSRHQVRPVFEARYARAIDAAPAPSMTLGTYPPEARSVFSALPPTTAVFAGFDDPSPEGEFVVDVVPSADDEWMWEQAAAPTF